MAKKSKGSRRDAAQADVTEEEIARINTIESVAKCIFLADIAARGLPVKDKDVADMLMRAWRAARMQESAMEGFVAGFAAGIVEAEKKT